MNEPNDSQPSHEKFSDGIYVVRLAGIANQVISRVKAVIKELEEERNGFAKEYLA
jgi:DNA mismatch repair ATPase MutS